MFGKDEQPWGHTSVKELTRQSSSRRVMCLIVIFVTHIDIQMFLIYYYYYYLLVKCYSGIVFNITKIHILYT